MSEDKSKESEAERRGIEERNEEGPLPSADIADPEVAANNPLSIRDITQWTIVDPGKTFEYQLDATGKHHVSMYVYVNGGDAEWLRDHEWTEGWDWHTSKLTNSDRTGPVRLFHMWKYQNQNSGWHDINCFISPLPKIDSLSVFTNAITGSGGYGTTLKLVTPNASHTLSANFTASRTQWSTTLMEWVRPGSYEMLVEQSVHGYTPRYTERRSCLYLTYPKVTTPANNGVVALGSAMPVHGTWGAYNEEIQVANEGGTHFFGQVRADGDGNWGITVDAKLYYPAGGWVFFNVRHVRSVNAAWTQVKTFLLAPPAFDGPSEVEMNPRITGTGHTGITGHSVDVFPNVSTQRIGSGWVVDGRWYADVPLAPGRHVLTAAQLYGPAISERTASREYHVRPPQPSLASERVGDRIYLSGIGYNGTDVKMHVHGEGGAFLLDATVNSGSWKEAIPDNIQPTTYTLTGRQSVSNGGTGRIYSSGWVANISVNVPTPVPIVAIPTVKDLNVTFSGSGRLWGTAVVEVNIFEGKGVEPADVIVKANVLPSLGWMETVLLSPGTYTELAARQWVNSQFSDPVAIPPVVVSSPIPDLEKPGSGAIVGQTPHLKGSAYQGSVVTFSIPGVEPFTETAGPTGIFDVTAQVELPPGPHTMTVTATFGGQTSQPLTRTYTVKTPPPRISASDGDKLDPVPTLTGLGYKGCWLVIHEAIGHRALGSGPVGPDGTWSVQLEELPLGALAIYAVQLESQNSSNKSDPTDTVTLDVDLQSPTILIPAHRGKTERMSEFSGEAQYGATVELYLKGQLQPFIKDIVVERNSTWKHIVMLPAGMQELEVANRYKGILSLKSEHSITVVPAVPKIDTPLPAEKVGKLLTVSGFGHGGDEIVIVNRATQGVLGSTTVLADKTWSATIEQTEATDLGVAVMARAGAGLDSAYTDTVQFTQLTPAPKIIEPQPGDWTGVRPLYSGLAEPGATITVALWFNADTLLAEPTVADEDGRWSVWGNKDLLEGAAWVVIRQTLDGTLSEWVESGRFMVARMLANFEAPTVTFPLIGQEVGRWPMFEGKGVPGSVVTIVKTGDSHTVLGTARVDRKGAWAMQSQIELPVGDDYECAVRQTRDGETSKWLVPDRTFSVIQIPAHFEAPVIEAPQDDPSKTDEQQPEFSGTGVVGAEVVVRLYNKPDVLAKTIVDARNKWRVRSEVVMTVGQREIVAEQFRDGQRSALSNTVTFTVAEKLHVPITVSPKDGAHISPYGVVEGTASPGTMVTLVDANQVDLHYGTGVTDAQGRWLIVVNGLPLRRFSLTGDGKKE